MKNIVRQAHWGLYCLSLFLAAPIRAQTSSSQVGREVAIPAHLQDGDEFTTPIRSLILYGEKLFNAKFTVQEGAGRPLSRGIFPSAVSFANTAFVTAFETESSAVQNASPVGSL
jgi:hypothetical protein